MLSIYYYAIIPILGLGRSRIGLVTRFCVLVVGTTLFLLLLVSPFLGVDAATPEGGIEYE